MNGYSKDAYDSLIEKATKETDPGRRGEWIVEILDLICRNHLPHIEMVGRETKIYMKKLNKKLTWALVVGGVLALFLLLTHPEVFSIFRAMKGV